MAFFSTERLPEEADPSELDQMCNQVLEVLPHVPPDVVKQDLALTKDVDLTITHLLEGDVEFSSLEGSVSASPASSRSLSPTNVRNLSFSPAIIRTIGRLFQKPKATSHPTVFGKNFKDRQMSFEERKRALIENARLRYLEKRGMES